MNVALQISGNYNSERIFKIGQYLMKLCVEHLGLAFFGAPCMYVCVIDVFYGYVSTV